MDRFLVSVCELAANPTAQSVGLGVGAAVIGILGTLFTGRADDQGLTLLQELIEIENTNKTNTMAQEQYKELVELGGLVAAVVVVGGAAVLGAVFYLWARLRKTESQLGQIRNLLEKSTGSEEEMFYNVSIRLQQEEDRMCMTFDELMAKNFSLIDEKVAHFQAKMKSCRQAIRTEFDKLKDIRSETDTCKQELQQFDTSLTENGCKLKELQQSLDSLKSKVQVYDADIDTKSELMEKEYELTKIQLCKSNLMLTNSQILFEKILGKLDEENAMDLSDVLKDLDHGSFDQDDYLKSYMESTDLTLVDFGKKLDLVQLTLSSHQEDIEKSKMYVQESKDNMTKELTLFKSHNEQWLYNWISVLYGLFNSDVAQLQLQLLGIDDLDSLKKLEQTGVYLKDECVFIENFIFDCKKQCFSLLREISLLLFEFYLLKTEYLSQDQILKECESRVESTVKGLFHMFDLSLGNSGLSDKDSTNLRQIVYKFEDKLVSDLNLTCSNFNVMVKQNLDDFLVIFRTLREMDERLPMSDEDSSVIIADSESTRTSDSWGLEDVSSYKPLRLVEKRASG
ncbi:hypothetical protein OGAPHI_003284 [Ogataea philodendri]|uniref:Uncharacterized protein n=1 Tax=Ogataea philodendri TaxID=1378263 RepID=A0A9P8P890_9ASCO|nr:uncharacterized protein OGAPHI_003284 [Ogataea philodendri]KAH3666835.1 hypothetical protein OGAPHI_003284 [Ogataea philodendri]